MILLNLLVVFQKLYRMPAYGRMIGIAGFHSFLQGRKLRFHLFPVIQNILFGSFLVMMHHRMHQNVKTCPLRGGNRDYRDIPQHLRQTVHVNLHPPFLHNIHHI